MKACTICNKEKMLTAFSTLARWQVSKSETESKACTPCYWMQLVTHYPSFSLDSGLCIVTFMPRDEPRWEYVTKVEARLPALKKDEKVVKAYIGLGPIDEQIRPFREWVERVK